MSIYKIDNATTREEIEDFYNLYVESFRDLCVWKGDIVINLAEYIEPSKDIGVFIEGLDVTINGLGNTIYYTHNDDVITSIAFVEIDEKTRCFVKINFLCGNQTTREDKINGKSQGTYMLDYIFDLYKDYIILIEPATPQLISYYVKYKKPCFPYDKSGLLETNKYLIYGNLRMLPEICFAKIFKSINIINKLTNSLQFKSTNDLYLKTNNLSELRAKLITKLDYLVKKGEFRADYYEQTLDSIMLIKYYDIEQIILESYEFERNTSSSSKSASLTYGGKKQNLSKRKIKKRKTKKNYKKTKRII